MHPPKRRFKPTREAAGFSAIQVLPCGLQSAAHPVQRGRVGRQQPCGLFVFGERVRDQLGQPQGVQQTAGVAAGEDVAGAGQQRQPGRERVAGDGAGAVGQGVEEQVGGGKPCPIFGQGKGCGKLQPGGIDAACSGLAAKIGGGGGVGRVEPQHAAGHRRQQANPYAEYFRRDLVAVAEAAEHEACRWQSASGARWCGEVRREIDRQETPWQVHDLLGVIGLLMHRQGEGIGDDVVDGVTAHGAGVAKPVHLHRRRPARHDSRPLAGGEAVQIDQDVDAVIADARRRVGIAACSLQSHRRWRKCTIWPIAAAWFGFNATARR